MEIMINDANFEEEVLNSSIPVLVDFFATWCGPCKMLSPIVEEISNDYEGKLKVCILNVDESPRIAKMFNVYSIPTLILFKEKKVLKTIIGFKPKEAIIKEFDL